MTTVSDAIAVTNGPAAPRRRGITRSSAGRGAWLGMAPFTVYVLIFLGLPLYEVIHGAFTTDAGQLTLHNFSTIFSGSQYWIPLKNSLILSAWTALVGAIFGPWLAAAVVAEPGRQHAATRGRRAPPACSPTSPACRSRSLLIAAYGRPPGGVITTWLKDIGIDLYAHGFSISSLVGVGLAYVFFQVPLMVILITPALEGLRPQWQEAARTSAPPSFEYMRHVAVPVMAPSFIGALLILFGNAFSAYATALALVGGTLPLSQPRSMRRSTATCLSTRTASRSRSASR